MALPEKTGAAATAKHNAAASGRKNGEHGWIRTSDRQLRASRRIERIAALFSHVPGFAQH
jgi:hypothetical protein